MPTHVETLETEVVAEPETPTASSEQRPVWRELDRLRSLNARLVRERLRTAASGDYA